MEKTKTDKKKELTAHGVNAKGNEYWFYSDGSYAYNNRRKSL